MPPSDTNLAGDSSAAAVSPPRFSEDIDSACSTPFVSAPSSPGRGPSGYFFSAPASPMHYLFTTDQKSEPSSIDDYDPVFLPSDSGSFEFEFSSRFSPNGSGANASMTAADELFSNGQIRPMKLSSHLERPQDMDTVSPCLDLYSDDVGTLRGRDLRSRSVKYAHRKARSMSPLRGEWRETSLVIAGVDHESEIKENENESTETTPSSSRSSSSGRNSKKWIFLKDLLRRSKSEGRTTTTTNKEKFWSAISFSPAKEKVKTTAAPPPSSESPALSPPSSRDETKGKAERKAPPCKRPANGVWRRPSAHELHYTANRAQAEEMKKKTFLPYRQGLLGCLGFSSKSYGAFSGFTRTLNPISSR